MGAPAGNQFWRLRATHGRAKLFASADALWESCCEYFQHVENNPLQEDSLSFFQGVPSHDSTAKMRAMTLDGLTVFLDIDIDTWRTWRSDKDFSAVVSRVDRIIRDQKFTGAAAGLLNPNIIARDLGLADKKELTGANGDPIAMVSRTMTPQEAAEAYASTLNGQA